jgi:hypothetical protein
MTTVTRHPSFPQKTFALAIALAINGMIFGGIAYLFSGQIHGTRDMTALAKTETPRIIAPAI